ncbi:bifunctional phosphopantothenoylcysteine decarboxylase/phosphopantothenate--cysteine ligase CoaBC [Magnetospirillum sp. SS-4]|uniref:bifunctional phosphopantothenoylcysteine decarboxylase/phosphopantothenate--cysteine ligase CoaBC n=1 Tax=Magnetospirillum sp. SS-4 TaxID=2681465 RepID=UPI0013846A86|nr:bifunctional phosphopantothenoylcysteine decarboxylase/phosphopantothenate--cysteine ligase CoaBC [Magnetospirillum sp. SS-4]CAA7618812.1 fused 4'-phosphopantothenoylcysteine decarboxylase; phosphopantothenoylcysteine synthetase, FMN-binding [Magnetospirillum sp. SS-4]
MLDGRRVLLIISGGIAAYKSLELIRRLKDKGCAVRCILTRGGANFVTPLAVAALSGDKVYQETFSLTDEAEMGHIRLSREADLVVVAPATANLLAKMAAGIADDLASTALLATDKPVLVAPAMNTMMWDHAATRANMAVLEGRGISRIGPNSGDLACGEVGGGRMAEPAEILAAIEAHLGGGAGPLAGRRAIVTSGPTHEPIDPVRYIANRSSGKQGHAIASALAALGAEVTLVSGPVTLPDPAGLTTVRVESAADMLRAVEAALPADIAVCAAAVADWTVANRSGEKRKKSPGAPPPVIELTPNPDILATLSKPGPRRPRLVVGFAAETEKLMEHARDKLARKGCDWIVANDVSAGSGTFGGDSNAVHVIDASAAESWPRLGKDEVAARLAARIAAALEGTP